MRLCVPVFVYIAAEKLDCFVYIAWVQSHFSHRQKQGYRNIFVYVAGVEG